MITKSENGLYQPGQSLVHKLDPRIKILSALTLVALAFAAGTWMQLALLLAVASCALLVISAHVRLVWRICLMLRWLILFTFLMHLLLSPGRTLWGLGWLSLDGLYMGFFVSLQILLAAIMTTTLAVTTKVEDLAAAFGWFVQPLSRLGCRTEDWQKILLLALGFIPVVQEEIYRSGRAEDVPAKGEDQGRQRRWSKLCLTMQAFTERMLVRGDDMAHEIAANGSACRTPAAPPSIWPLSLPDRYIVAAMILVMACHWLAG